MLPDDDVCICFHVPLRKIRAYLERENPAAASQISECLGAGTGCHWCVPFLRHLHAQHQQGMDPDLGVTAQDYASRRLRYHKTNVRELPREVAPFEEVPDPPGTGPVAGT